MTAQSGDQDLGEMDSEEDFSFPPAERRVITQPLDLSVQTLDEQWRNAQLVLPEIQREYVWDNAKASRLIESLLLNIPIPVLYFAETEEAKYEIFDGHQRVRSNRKLFGWPVCSDWAGCSSRVQRDAFSRASRTRATLPKDAYAPYHSHIY